MNWDKEDGKASKSPVVHSFSLVENRRKQWTWSKFDEVHLEKSHELGPRGRLIGIRLEAVGQKGQCLVATGDEVPEGDGHSTDIQTTVLVTLGERVADFDRVDEDRPQQVVRLALSHGTAVLVASGREGLQSDR